MVADAAAVEGVRCATRGLGVEDGTDGRARPHRPE